MKTSILYMYVRSATYTKGLNSPTPPHPPTYLHHPVLVLCAAKHPADKEPGNEASHTYRKPPVVPIQYVCA